MSQHPPPPGCVSLSAPTTGQWRPSAIHRPRGGHRRPRIGCSCTRLRTRGAGSTRGPSQQRFRTETSDHTSRSARVPAQVGQSSTATTLPTSPGPGRLVAGVVVRP
ncbi:hypothetical protein [Ornithinimicrobium kibberense]|uniref:hypothetical protein n=1 Tax=Ornithinimicrobium kibberense TaxID=282060 RepID=UPI0036070EAC